MGKGKGGGRAQLVAVPELNEPKGVGKMSTDELTRRFIELKGKGKQGKLSTGEMQWHMVELARAFAPDQMPEVG